MKLVILTASRMSKTIDGKEYSGKCVTGLDLDSNRVVRLVQNKFGAPMENPYCNIYSPLDVCEVTFKEACPLKYQTENILSDYKQWKFIEKYQQGIQNIYKRMPEIQKNDSSFMKDGTKKVSDISPYKHSLEMIQVNGLQINGNKCSFAYNGYNYSYMSLTDPEYILGPGQSKYIGDAYIVVTIPTDPHTDQYYYKFVASVFPYT